MHLRVKHPIRAAGAALLAVAVLAGCAGSPVGPSTAVPSPSTTPGASLYEHLSARMAAAGTATYVFSGTGGGETFAGSGAMRFEPDGFDGDVQLTMPQTGRVRAVLVPDASYLALPAAKGLPKNKPWVRVTERSDTPIGRQLRPVVEALRTSFDPEQSLGLLRFAGQVEEVGPATVEGVPTTHYRAEVNLRRARRAATGPAREQYQSMLDAGARWLGYDVWIDTTDLPRRFSARLPTVQGVFSVTGIYRDWGAEVRIAQPGPKQVFDANKLKG